MLFAFQKCKTLLPTVPVDFATMLTHWTHYCQEIESQAESDAHRAGEFLEVIHHYRAKHLHWACAVQSATKVYDEVHLYPIDTLSLPAHLWPVETLSLRLKMALNGRSHLTLGEMTAYLELVEMYSVV